MIIKAKIAGFTFETTFDQFFQNNPELDCEYAFGRPFKEWVKSELCVMGDVTFRYSEAYVTCVTLVLVKE